MRDANDPGGWVTEAGSGRVERFDSSSLSTDPVTIGLDVGGTKVAGGLVTRSGEVRGVRERATLVDGHRDPGLKVTLAVAEELMNAAHKATLRVDGIGVGFPEYVGHDGLLRSHEVLAWTEQPAALLSELAPVTVESDVRCAALGEAARGAAQGLASFAFVIVGTGISYTLVEDGEPRQGRRGEAIALGELEVSRRVDAADLVTLEGYASGEAIRERYASQGGRSVDGAADVARLAASGDAIAASVLASAACALAEGLVSLTRLLDPGAIVVGGGVSGARGVWRNVLKSTLEAGLRSRPEPPSLRWAQLGREAGIIGAAIAHRRRLALARSEP